MELKDIIRKHALHNAVRYGGKANTGAVVGKVISEKPELKGSIKDVARQVNDIVKKVNSMKPEEQLKELKRDAPELLDEKKTEEQKLPELPNAEAGKVVTAFPPEPSGYPHIGHAKGIIVNYEYAKKYDGKFILRFEDTNPELAKKEFYGRQIEGYEWLGIKWDKLIYISDTIPQMYTKAEELITKGIFYACNCPVEEIKKKRMAGEECSCRSRNIADSINLFKEMLGGRFEKGEVIIRWKGSMEHQNTAMRDPAMFRVIKKSHERTGDRFIVWPSYDFAAAFSDGAEGITHRVRSKEFELRTEVQAVLQKLMGFKQTIIISQARFNFEGVEASKRKIREKIAAGELVGWDDPRLSTLVALKRRGFLPEAIKNFLRGLSITKHESIITWDRLEAENRKVIEPAANRYFFVAEPVKISVEGAPERTVKIGLHPDFPERGTRQFSSAKEFYIAKEDFGSLKQNQLYRLMECLNFKKTAKGFKFDSAEYEKYREKGKKIMHWLPAAGQLVDIEIMMPDATRRTGYGEADVKSLSAGSIIQFERFGFCRLDSIEKEKFFFWFTHK